MLLLVLVAVLVAAAGGAMQRAAASSQVQSRGHREDQEATRKEEAVEWLMEVHEEKGVEEL